MVLPVKKMILLRRYDVSLRRYKTYRNTFVFISILYRITNTYYTLLN